MMFLFEEAYSSKILALSLLVLMVCNSPLGSSYFQKETAEFHHCSTTLSVFANILVIWDRIQEAEFLLE
jgi:hypothetical protein